MADTLPSILDGIPNICLWVKVRCPETQRVFMGAIKAERIPIMKEGYVYLAIMVSLDLRPLPGQVREWAYMAQRQVPGIRWGSLMWLNGLLQNQSTTIHRTFEEAETSMRAGLEALVPGWSSRPHDYVLRPLPYAPASSGPPGASPTTPPPPEPLESKIKRSSPEEGGGFE